MKKYIVLFRGINVGGNNILPMKSLKDLLEALGCKNVKTYIQSGNVVLETKEANSAKLAQQIGLKIEEEFGFNPKVLLLELNDFYEVINNNPFDTSVGKALHVFISGSIPESPDLEKINELKSATEEYKLVDNKFYLYAPDGIGRSKLAAKVEQCLGVDVTARNWNTISKLAELAGQK